MFNGSKIKWLEYKIECLEKDIQVLKRDYVARQNSKPKDLLEKQKREKRNAYQREYMRKRRNAKKEVNK